jgi:hypothetical protein
VWRGAALSAKAVRAATADRQRKRHSLHGLSHSAPTTACTLPKPATARECERWDRMASLPPSPAPAPWTPAAMAVPHFWRGSEGCRTLHVYYINEFNPNSKYHLSLGLNYPNASDKILSDSVRPGGAIYIHGSCVSTGCIAISDIPIEELYIIATNVRTKGQDFIPVHVFPVKYNNQKSVDQLTESFKSNLAINKFILSLKTAFDYFEEKKQLPVILVNKKGEYIIN